jgi:hypothetical protein
MSFNYHEYLEGQEMSLGATPDKEGEDSILESATVNSVDRVTDFADSQMRSMAMGAVLAWVDGGDFAFNNLDECLVAITDMDGEDGLTEDEMNVYEDIWPMTVDAMLSLGADPENVVEFLSNEDGDSGEKLGGFLGNVMDNMPSTDDEIITTFATGEDGVIFECANGTEGIDDQILEAVYKKAKVIRGGKVMIKKKRISGKVRLSAAQKAGLKKARRKANTSAAKQKRKKSNKQRAARGL